MENSAAALAAAVEATVFLGYFNEMPDHRQAGKVAYPLDEVLLLALMAVLAGAEGFTDIARFGEKKLALLRRFRPFRNGTPSHDHLGDLFAALDAQAFRRCFVAWVAGLTGTQATVIAIDGKTSLRSGSKGARDALHTVSAFAARERLVPAQLKTDAKSNEITAIPALADLLSVKGAVVTIDAMGCQRESIRYEQEVFLTQIRSPFTSALAVSSSLRMIAMIATLAGFPAWRSAAYLVLRSGLKRIATKAGM
jgi:hypothetical protein